jgi:hypothetical protein
MSTSLIHIVVYLVHHCTALEPNALKPGNNLKAGNNLMCGANGKAPALQALTFLTPLKRKAMDLDKQQNKKIMQLLLSKEQER